MTAVDVKATWNKHDITRCGVIGIVTYVHSIDADQLLAASLCSDIGPGLFMIT